MKPRIIKWDGKPGEEVAYVISQNVRRRHLNESQRGMIASKLAALPSGQRQAGKFAGVPTQAETAKMMQVSERTVRTARKVEKEAPANLTRLVKDGRMKLNAVESRQTLEPRTSSASRVCRTMTQGSRSSASTRRAPVRQAEEGAMRQPTKTLSGYDAYSIKQRQQ